MNHVHSHLAKTHEAMIGSLGPSPAAASSDTGSGDAPDAAHGASVSIKAEGEPKAVEKGVEKASQEVKKVTHEAPGPAVGSAEYFKKAREGSKKTPKAHK